MEPKPVKPLVAFAMARDGNIRMRFIAPTVAELKFAVDNGRAGGWIAAQEDGYHIIRVRIEPVEE